MAAEGHQRERRIECCRGGPRTGIATGNIEFWRSNYGTGNGAGVPGASGGVYDFGDGDAGTSAGYGSMQVHNHDAGQVVFAYNAWGSGGRIGDLGIGNNTLLTSTDGRINLDWTFRNNAGGYEIANIFVLAHVLPEPTTLLIWSMLAAVAVTLRWRRR